MLCSCRSFGSKSFDEMAARAVPGRSVLAVQLSSLSVHQIMIVPQGRLVHLPFEALVERVPSAPAIDRWAISYAPTLYRRGKCMPPAAAASNLCQHRQKTC